MLYRRTGIPLLMLVAAGCCADPVPGPELVPVGFADASPAATRAAGTWYVDGAVRKGIPAGRSFGVYAWTGASASGAPDFMAGQYVVNEGGSEDGVFTYSPVKYWPGDTPLSFQGYYPYGEGTGITPVPSAGPLSFSFTASATPSSQVDFLLSDTVEGATAGGDGTVPMRFRHALARVSFTAEASADLTAAGMTIRSVSAVLSGVRDTGTCTKAPGNGGAVSWTSVSGSASCTLAADGAPADVLLAVPQPTAGLTLSVSWTMENAAGAEVSVSAETALPDGGPAAWEAGTAYAYTLSLSSGDAPLEITATAAPWEHVVREMDYSTEITVKNSGRIAWQSGTYEEKDEEGHTVVLAFGTAAVCTFTIDTPAGGIWRAVLKTEGGVMGAFGFQDGDGGIQDTASGEVGTEATLRIRARDDRPATENSAVLMVFVESGGRNTEVATLVDGTGSRWKVIQNRSL